MRPPPENKAIKTALENKDLRECPTNDDLYSDEDLSMDDLKARRERQVKRERLKKWRSAS